MKMGNTVPRVGLEPTSLAFWASVLPLHHTGSLMSPLSPRLPVDAAPCLRGHGRLLQYFKMFIKLKNPNTPKLLLKEKFNQIESNWTSAARQ